MIGIGRALKRLPRTIIRLNHSIKDSILFTMTDQGKRVLESSKGSAAQTGKIGGMFEKKTYPDFIAHRLNIFIDLYKKQEEALKASEHPEITITLPDGKQVKGRAFETTPLDIALGISKGLAEAVVGAKVKYTNKLKNPLFANFVEAADEEDEKHKLNNDVKDLFHKLEGDCNISLLKFDSPEGKTMFWHSSAHLLGQAIENLYGAYLTHGPPLESGFFYDSFVGDNHISKDQFEDIEKNIDDIIAQNQPFERLIISKAQALEMFKYNPFKLTFIQNKIPEGAATSVYRCGNLIDLCTGPHVPSTGKVKAVKLTNASSSYWLANSMNDSLQRVYGISFPSKKELTEYVKMQDDLEKRDHRNIGEQQKLFTFTKYAPGCPNFLPHGTRIISRLQGLVRREYIARGFTEVKSSVMNNEQLWMTSGHYFKYKDDMYFLKNDEHNVALKPMNCPVHCSVFDLHLHSYRDLPIRMCDFGVLHRNEIAGALSGLTRVRQFHQDDAHIYCTEDQLLTEIQNCIDFVQYIYSIFGFKFQVELSTRPPMRVGSDEIWDKAEETLRLALVNAGKEFKVGEGEGAFYGPKIDIKVSDCYGRVHQLGTIQLDFNLPERFNLQYRAPEDAGEDKQHSLTEKELENKISQIKKEDNKIEVQKQFKSRISAGEKVTMEQIEAEFKIPQYNVSGKLKPGFKRPIMIHRAICGSLERCVAILCEHFGGKWPFWLSPRQIIVIPVSEKFEVFAEKVHNRLLIEGYFVDVDKSSSGINKKVRDAQIAQYNYILVVGEKEESAGTVSVRDRDQEKPLGVFTIDQLLNLFKSLEPAESSAWTKLKSSALGCTVQDSSHEIKDKDDKTPKVIKKEESQKEEKSKEEVPKEEKPKEVKPKEEKPKEAKPKEEKPKEVKPKEDKPKEVKPKEEKKEGKKKDEVDPEIIALEKALLDRVYLSGEGLDYGEDDKKHFEITKEKKFNSHQFPNVARWLKFIAAKHHKAEQVN